MKTSLKCHCGKQIARRDVMQQGYYDKQFGPSYVYIKFRCSRCKKLGEHFVKQEEWQDSLLTETQGEATTEERGRFKELGAITIDEMRSVHRMLEGLTNLPAPTREESQ